MRAAQGSRSTKGMKIPQPKRWWFPTVLVAAMLLQGLIIFTFWSIWVVVNADAGDDIRPQTFLYLAGAIAYTGSIAFPIGLWGIVVWSSRLLENHFAVFVGAGWVTYLAVVGAGVMKPRNWNRFSSRGDSVLPGDRHLAGNAPSRRRADTGTQ